MTELDQGVSIAGAPVRGWVVVVSADYPAAGLLAGFKKSVSANFFCRECDCDQSDNALIHYEAPRLINSLRGTPPTEVEASLMVLR